MHRQEQEVTPLVEPSVVDTTDVLPDRTRTVDTWVGLTEEEETSILGDGGDFDQIEPKRNDRDHVFPTCVGRSSLVSFGPVFRNRRSTYK